MTADAVCHWLESKGLRCWMAPRDIPAGADWSEAVLRAIGSCQLMVVVFSDHANQSRHVRIEVAQAFKRELTIIPFRIEQTAPKGSLEYYLDAVHWLDALTPPLERHLDELSDRVEPLVSPPGTSRRVNRADAEGGKPVMESETQERPKGASGPAEAKEARLRPASSQGRTPPKALKKSALVMLSLMLIVVGTSVWFAFNLSRADDRHRQGGSTASPTPSLEAPSATESASNILTFDKLDPGPLPPDAFVERGVRFIPGKGEPVFTSRGPTWCCRPVAKTCSFLAVSA